MGYSLPPLRGWLVWLLPAESTSWNLSEHPWALSPAEFAPTRALAAEAMPLECALSDLVNQASGLTPEEIALMWQTAPPRMPIPPPQ